MTSAHTRKYSRLCRVRKCFSKHLFLSAHTLSIILMMVGGLSVPTFADPTPVEPANPPIPATDPTSAKPAPAPSSDLPTLDEMLGIAEPSNPASLKDPTDASKTQTSVQQHTIDLDRVLSAQETDDAFEQAVQMMDDAAHRLDSAKDTGLDTQRIQEDVIKRLDQLIASLEKNQQQQQQQSGTPDPSQSQSQSKPMPAQQRKSAQQTAASGDPKNQDPSHPGASGTLGPNVDSARAAWGGLPARVRDSLMQGTSDRFSSKYKALTEEYYKRLAEEHGK